MQKCRFSETQYSFCFVFEYLQTRTPHFLSQYLKPIPFFTDTVNEGKYYGFDVCVGNYFLQFKKSNLFDIGDPHPKFFNAYNSNYYKLKINTDAKQFKKLESLRPPAQSLREKSGD